MLGCAGTPGRASSPDSGQRLDAPTADAGGPGRDASPSADGAAPGDTREVVQSDAPPDEDDDGSTDDAATPQDASTDALALDVAVGADITPTPEPGRPRRLSLIVANGPWKSFDDDGLASDAQHRVYHVDGQNIFMIERGVVSNYLTLAEAAGQLGMRAAYYLVDIDQSAEGGLHVLLKGSWPGVEASATVVARSSGAHLLTTWRDLSTYTASRLSVIDAGRVVFVDYDGPWIATTAGKQMVFPASMPVRHCYGEEVTATPSGVFLYQPGCMGTSLLRGRVDGSVGTLYQPTAAPIYGADFLCTARDPRGGFYVMVNDLSREQPRVYHFAEDAQGTMGITHLVTEPSFGEARQSQSQARPFGSCSMATAPDGTIYVQTGAQLWEVSPQ
jgi:hypothetical protein